MHFGRHHEHAPDDHRENEHIVELMRVSSRFEADVIVAALEARGIKASASGNGAMSTPRVTRVPANRVFVFESDLEVARALVSEEGFDGDRALDTDE